MLSAFIEPMQDQVITMRELGVRASFLYSTLDAATTEVERTLIEVKLDLLSLVPERLTQEGSYATNCLH